MASLAQRMLALGAELEKQAFQPMPAGQQMDQMGPEQMQQMGIDPAQAGMVPPDQAGAQGAEQIPMVGEVPADQFMQLIQEVVSGAIQQVLPQIQQMLMANAGAEGKGKGGAQGELGAKLDQIIALMGGTLPSNGVPPGAQQVPPGGAGVPPAGPGGVGTPPPPQPQPGMQVSASVQPKLADILLERVKNLRG